jgi:hypothetical protein
MNCKIRLKLGGESADHMTALSLREPSSARMENMSEGYEQSDCNASAKPNG